MLILSFFFFFLLNLCLFDGLCTPVIVFPFSFSIRSLFFFFLHVYLMFLFLNLLLRLPLCLLRFFGLWRTTQLPSQLSLQLGGGRGGERENLYENEDGPTSREIGRSFYRTRINFISREIKRNESVDLRGKEGRVRTIKILRIRGKKKKTC